MRHFLRSWLVAAVVVGFGAPLWAVTDMEKDAALNREWVENVFSEPKPDAAMDMLSIVHEDAPGDTKANRCSFGGPLRLGDRVYERGIGVNSHSVLRVSLAKPAKRFLADVGLDRNVDSTPASVCFHVAVGGQDVFATDVMRPKDGMRRIDVPLSGARAFELIVDIGGDNRSFDQGDWGDARVELDDGSVVWLDDLAKSAGVFSDLPFSFVYGGKSSRDFLAAWPRTVEEETPEPSKRIRTVTMTDPATGLEVRAVCTLYLDTPGADWIVYFTNKGTKDTPVLEQVRALDAAFSCVAGSTATFHSLRSTWKADDWIPFSEPLAPGKRHEFAPIGGRSSSGACPFFNVQWDNGGAVVGIGWTGQWAAAAENGNGRVAVQAGMQNLHLALHPGESIRSPRILLMRWSGTDEARAYNLWRATMLRHIVPRVGGEVVVPPIAHLSTAFYEMDKATEATALSHLDAIKDLGFECYWYDAYYGKDDFPTVGNYVLPVERGFNQGRFPNQLKPVADAVHQAGMKFLLWFEPERICPGTLMATEHPDWVVLPDDGGWGMFNLGVPEARQHITDYIGGLIDAYGLSWVRIDNAVTYIPLWQKLDAAAGPDRVGMAEIRYVEGLYRWWDDMRAAHPNIAIDDCASGGGRIDLELCARSIPLWRTDATITPLMNHDFNQAAIQNQLMTAALSRYVPFNVSGQMGATPYWFRSGFNGGISFCEDCRPADYWREQLKQAIAEGKRIRKYFFGDLYSMTDITTSAKEWSVSQYHRSGEQDGMIVVFRRHASPYVAFECELREIEPDAEYEIVSYHNYEPSAPVRMKGSEFLRYRIEIAECPGSVIVEYAKKGE